MVQVPEAYRGLSMFESQSGEFFQTIDTKVRKRSNVGQLRKFQLRVENRMQYRRDT